MRALVTLALVLVVVQARPKPRRSPCMSPAVWEAKIDSYDRHTGYYSRARMAYDAQGMQIRVVEEVDENSTRSYHDNLYLFGKHAHYRVDMKTRKCEKLALNNTFRPVEIYLNSTYIGDAIIGTLDGPGTGVVVQTWTHKTENGGEALQIFTVAGCIPVENEYRFQNSEKEERHLHVYYYDITPGVFSPEVFDVPKECL